MRKLTLAVLVLAAACGVPEATEAQPPAGTASGPLEGAFTAAAREYQVPVEVLKGIGWVETRLSTQANLESGSGGVGVMQLARRADVDTLAEAGRLTGVTEGRLRVDPAANIRGAAAVLRQRFDESQARTPALDARELGDWYEAVSFYPGFESATAAADYAADVFRALESGFAGQAPTTSRWRTHAPVQSSREDAVKEYPAAAAWVASPNYTSGRSTYEFVLIHTMQGSYAGTKSWFQNPASQVSSHYIVRSSDGQVTQMVEHKNTAWHAQCYNSRSIGIEHEGYVADPATWYTTAMYTESAKLTAWIATRHSIPKNRSHIIGHVEVPAACNTGRHSDPGSGWNWTRYMQLVTGSTPTPTSGVLIGAIYTGGSTSNRVSGATVKVGSQTVTTGSDGVYQFSLAPGSYTATVTKAGYGSATVTRTVTSSTQVWGSMEINPTAATGTLRGNVYAYNPADPSDMSQRVAGATVKVGSQTVTSGSDGAFLFTLAPGTYTVTASKSGYVTNSLARTVTASQTIWGSVGLSTPAMADTQKPDVAITFPASGAGLDLGRIELRGTASDNVTTLAEVKVSLNGGAETSVPVTAGAFAVELQLGPGTNEVSVKASDAAGNTASATTTVTYHAGVAGFVRTGEAATPVEGASIELRESGSGTVVSTVESDASGAYFAPVMTVDADYLVTVKKPHFLTHAETVTVTAEAQLSLDVTLEAGEDQAETVTVSFVEPMDGATVTTDTVTVYGSVAGFDLAALKVNDVQAELLGAGGFSATVPLQKGSNTLTAVATGTTGQTASGVLHVTRVDVTNSLGNPMPMVKGGCSVGGLELLAGLTALLLLRRRARA